jgi:hypothetical protein
MVELHRRHQDIQHYRIDLLDRSDSSESAVDKKILLVARRQIWIHLSLKISSRNDHDALRT